MILAFYLTLLVKEEVSEANKEPAVLYLSVGCPMSALADTVRVFDGVGTAGVERSQNESRGGAGLPSAPRGRVLLQGGDGEMSPRGSFSPEARFKGEAGGASVRGACAGRDSGGGSGSVESQNKAAEGRVAVTCATELSGGVSRGRSQAPQGAVTQGLGAADVPRSNSPREKGERGPTPSLVLAAGVGPWNGWALAAGVTMVAGAYGEMLVGASGGMRVMVAASVIMSGLILYKCLNGMHLLVEAMTSKVSVEVQRVSVTAEIVSSISWAIKQYINKDTTVPQGLPNKVRTKDRPGMEKGCLGRDHARRTVGISQSGGITNAEEFSNDVESSSVAPQDHVEHLTVSQNRRWEGRGGQGFWVKWAVWDRLYATWQPADTLSKVSVAMEYAATHKLSFAGKPARARAQVKPRA